jgi:GMP synthase (glutamine-hydrolysing)
MHQRINNPRRVLILLHQEHSTPGRLGRLLRLRGWDLDIRRPCLGDPLPLSLSDHAGAIIFGGPMSANDDNDWLRRELAWIEVPLKEEKPLLGICLGAQMMARCLGQQVYKHPKGKVEIGYYPISPTEHGHAVCSYRFPEKVYQWHREGFDLPVGATLLAAGQDFETQAFRFGRNAYGLQFHPEVTYAMMCRWTLRCPQPLETLPGAYLRHQHLEGWYRHDTPIALWLDAFLNAWLGQQGATTEKIP